MPFTPIHHTFGPHVTTAFAVKSLALLCTPWRWRKGPATAELKQLLKHWFDAPCYVFDSGRSALLALLRSLPFETGSEIIIQGYTCVALPNAIHAAGYTAVFADIDPDTLNISPNALEACITPRTRAVIVQHTFGVIADTQVLKEICDRHELALIEDCAHVLPDVTGPRNIGRDSDFLMLSFGRDKAISGVSGGAIVVKNNGAVCEAMENEEKRAKHMRPLAIKKLLLYPLLYALAKPIYGIVIGKALLWIAAKIWLLPPVLTGKEKSGYQSAVLRKMPDACAALAVTQLRQLHTINNHRRMLTAKYLDAAIENGWKMPAHINTHFPLQKFPIFLENADAMRKKLKQKNIYLEDGWTGCVVCPRNVHPKETGYISGNCPHAENIAERILTLPTHPTMTVRQAERLVKELKNLL